ncbi:MAG TPA: UDP-N-acetylmuramoyl-L-alanyl-D-glutamate--2,6-diaminopimelate ligase [Actinomycetota bacterium]
METSKTEFSTVDAQSLETLLPAVGSHDLRGPAAVEITDVTYRSEQATPGSLFFAVPGTRTDGHDFAADAVQRGASAVLVERWVDLDVTQIRVPSVRGAMGPLSAAFFGNPSAAMTMVGVTGTNGKTTVTYLLESIFRAAGLRAGVIGTTGVRIDGEITPFARTTPEAPDLQRLFATMRARGVQAVAMEVSSHGLDQHRVDGTRYACGIFTNLSQDHLDYHQTMEAYLEAKARLFTASLSNRGAINGDSPEGRSIARQAAIPTVTFGLGEGADVVAREVELSAMGVSFVVDGVGIRSALRGAFNVSNCLAALTAARSVGIGEAPIAEGIEALKGVPGRMEPVDAGQPFPVLVDYAHTPDSLENVLRTARGFTANRLIVVFGCGGDRDRGKRPQMGEVATRLADLTVITSDNPRSEEPEAIVREIEGGVGEGTGRHVVEVDRRAAIALALREADHGDVVIIAGKGHETGQEFRDRTIPFDDREVVREELLSRAGSRSAGDDDATEGRP